MRSQYKEVLTVLERRWRSRQIVWMMLLLSYQKSLEENQRLKELAKYLSMTEEEVKEVMKISLDALSVMEADIKQS